MESLKKKVFQEKEPECLLELVYYSGFKTGKLPENCDLLVLAPSAVRQISLGLISPTLMVKEKKHESEVTEINIFINFKISQLKIN